MASLPSLPFPLRRSSKKHDVVGALPFQNLEKGQVIQNVKMFSASKLKTRECYFLLTKARS